MSTMITCPWCGTHYQAFQPQCDNCGGILPKPARSMASAVSPIEYRHITSAVRELPVPPPAPRPLPKNYYWRRIFTDAAAIVGFVFTMIGTIFSTISCGFIVTIVGAPFGLPFLAIGGGLGTIGVLLLILRYQAFSRTAQVLQQGQSVLGQIVEVRTNYAVQVNHRHPWIIEYRFPVLGQQHEGQISTLKTPGPAHQPGQAIYVLYEPADPLANVIYPFI